MANEMDDLYYVANGVDDVVDQDHNTLVDATQFVYDKLGGIYNVGNGIDGNVQLGTISATTSTAPTSQANGAGRLTGTFYYKYAAYNLSGETAASSAATGLVLTAQQAKVTIPGTANNNNITGFYVYRSIDDVTYYRVGKVALDTPSDGAIFYDNFDITSGTAPQGSNTTGVTATADGIYKCRTFTLKSSETLTITDDTATGLIVLAQGAIDIQSGSSIVGTGKHALGAPKIISRDHIGRLDLSGEQDAVSTDGTQSSDNNQTGGYSALTGAFAGDLKKYFNQQGSGATSGTATKPGSNVVLISASYINVNGAITLTGATAVSGAGAAGGLFFAAAEYINRASATITSNGSNAVLTALTNVRLGGGGGGAAVFLGDYIVGSATVTVNGGTGATNGTDDTYYGGGGFGGAGGSSSSSGSAGVSQDLALNKFISGAV